MITMAIRVGHPPANSGGERVRVICIARTRSPPVAAVVSVFENGAVSPAATSGSRLNNVTFRFTVDYADFTVPWFRF